MSESSKAYRWYEANAAEVATRHEALDPEKVHHWWLDQLPKPPVVILDIGAGSGRDAAWLAGKNHDVIAVEPATAMIREGLRRRPNPKFRWIEDELPSLQRISRLEISFDLVLLSAVWMHVKPADRNRAFRKVIQLLKPGGALVMTIRQPPDPPEDSRGMHAVGPEEIEKLARDHGAAVVRSTSQNVAGPTGAILWTQILIRLPDDGTGALPLLRHIILNDNKSSTYKLALLRTLCRIADGYLGMVRETDDEAVEIPHGLVALFWIRQFKPLLDLKFPQSPSNVGYRGLEFAKGSLALLMVSPLDLRVAGRFTQLQGAHLASSLSAAARNITKMPTNFIRYPSGNQILSVQRPDRSRPGAALTLDREYLASFGWMRVPRHLWTALIRFNSWIEPAIIAEWARYILGYTENQGRKLDETEVRAALRWSDPERDVALARNCALKLLNAGELNCVWSGRPLRANTLDVDHCFPWSAWPCDHLWNLLPTHKEVNQRQKRDRLPSADHLREAEKRIISWWTNGYSLERNEVLTDRFFAEAESALPWLDAAVAVNVEDVFQGLEVQRLRLHHDQQVPEWKGRW
jgi:SAM-dependent methyltransferase